MMFRTTWRILLASALLIFHMAASAAEKADTIFTNAKAYTLDKSQPWAEAVAVSGNKIVYVGDAEGSALPAAAATSNCPKRRRSTRCWT